MRTGMKVSELIELLKQLPQDRTILCQVVEQDGPNAWNMCWSIENVENSDWIVQLRVEHPDLRMLPEFPEESPEPSDLEALKG